MKDWTKIVAYFIGSALIATGIVLAIWVEGAIEHPGVIGVFVTAGVSLFTGWSRNGIMKRDKKFKEALERIEKKLEKRISKIEKKTRKKKYNKLNGKN